MLSIVVKGEPNQAIDIALHHGINADIVKHNEKSTVLGVEDRHINKVMRWYGEKDKIIEGYGYPDGTLLHFTLSKMIWEYYDKIMAEQG